MTITQEMSRTLTDSTLSTIDALRALEPDDLARQSLVTLHESSLRTGARFASTPMPACPEWCASEPGHACDGTSTADPSLVMPNHERDFGDWYLGQDELISPDGSYTRGPVYLSSLGIAGEDCDLAAARQIRDNLTAAIDYLSGLVEL